MLPEIVYDGMNGLLIDGSPENLVVAIIKLAWSMEVREKMGQEARDRMLSSFSLGIQGERVEKFYGSFV